MFSTKEFLDFLKSGEVVSMRKPQNYITLTLKLYLLCVLVSVIATLGVLPIKLMSPDSIPVNHVQMLLAVPSENKIWLILFITLLGPLVEETAFRLSLVFNTRYFPISLTLLASILIASQSWLFFGLIFLCSYVLFHFLSRRYSVQIGSFYRQYPLLIVYFSSGIFGLLHSGNYSFTSWEQYALIPLLVLPQLFMGFLLAFSRLYYKNGFWLGGAMHVTLNSLSTFFSSQALILKKPCINFLR